MAIPRPLAETFSGGANPQSPPGWAAFDATSLYRVRIPSKSHATPLAWNNERL